MPFIPLIPFWTRVTITRLLLASLALAVCACGDGESASERAQREYELAVSAADSKRAEVRALAVASPCSQIEHCAVLKLQPTYPDPCSFTEDIDYSLISQTAVQAQVAAAQYSQLAQTARGLASPLPPGSSCTGFTRYRALWCISGSCTRL
jgi:hypothetical protein